MLSEHQLLQRSHFEDLSQGREIDQRSQNGLARSGEDSVPVGGHLAQVLLPHVAFRILAGVGLVVDQDETWAGSLVRVCAPWL